MPDSRGRTYEVRRAESERTLTRRRAEKEALVALQRQTGIVIVGETRKPGRPKNSSRSSSIGHPVSAAPEPLPQPPSVIAALPPAVCAAPKPLGAHTNVGKCAQQQSIVQSFVAAIVAPELPRGPGATAAPSSLATSAAPAPSTPDALCGEAGSLNSRQVEH